MPRRPNPANPSARTVRMRDVAERAGVGMMTVSRVLNGTAHVREETQARVYQALEELQYRPNMMARALRGFRTHSIGIIIPYLYDPFFASCAQAIGEVARQHSYSVLLATSDERAETEVEQLRELQRRQVEGIVIIPACIGRSRVAAAEFDGVPMVALDRPIPRSNFDRVLVENQKGAALATEHLIQHGHKRICLIGLSPKIYTIQARVAGYEKAMQAAGLEPECFFEGGDEAATLDFVRRVKSRPSAPTAIFASNGLSSRHALHALATLGIQIPDEIAFIGFDDFELANILRPALTVVRQPTQQLGHEAAKLLFARLHGAPDAPAEKRLLPVELVIRRSCGCHPS
jgi:LacI family transcriptional regulator